eukprot:403358724
MSDYSCGEESDSCNEEDEDKSSSENLFSEEDEDTEERESQQEDDPEDDDLYSSDLEEAKDLDGSAVTVNNPEDSRMDFSMTHRSTSEFEGGIKNFNVEDTTMSFISSASLSNLTMVDINTLSPQQKADYIKACRERYLKYMEKAQDCINISKSKEREFENQKQFYHESLKYYKRAIKVAMTDFERQNVWFRTGQVFFLLAGVQFESEFRAKYICRACKQFDLCLQKNEDFDINIFREGEVMRKFILIKIKERTDDLEVLQQIFEVLYETIPKEMSTLRDFCGNELFEIYYKLAIEVDNATGEKETALKYLQLAQNQYEEMKGIENDMVKMKIYELKKQQKQRDKKQALNKAHEKEQKADILKERQLYQKAINNYKKAIKYSRDRCIETEANCTFKIGKLLYEVHNDLNSALNYLVDFQLLTFILKFRTDQISKRFQESRQIIQEIKRRLSQELLTKKKSRAKLMSKEQEQEKLLLIITELQQSSQQLPLDKFIEHLLYQHPPRCLNDQSQDEIQAMLKKQKLNFNDKSTRKSLLRIITYYHPDKQPLDDELNLKVSTEITKVLNDLLRKYKN